jgi:Peptidase family S41
MNKLLLFFGFCIILLSACTSIKKYSPTKKYAPAALQQDYALLQKILEAKHPSLYWYTPKEKMDAYFGKYYNVIKDSMTEQQFAWLAVAPLLDKIHCGHTSMGLSKNYSKWARNKVQPSFPLYVKIINDSLVVYGNLNAKTDTIIKKGTVITSINGIPNKVMVQYMLEHLSEDGYANNVSLMRLSGNFPYYHRNIFGLSKKYNVTYLDSLGVENKISLPLYAVVKDTNKKDSVLQVKVVKEKTKKIPKAERLKFYRSLEIDSTKRFATLTLNTFSGGHLRKFFRKSFTQLKKENIQNIILDLRSNGGGRVGLSTLLTKYISKQKFKIADTVATQSRGVGGYGKYISGKFFNTIQMVLMSSKRADGKYHLKRFERHYYQPKKNNYAGNVYVLIGGNTFSASTLFCNAIKGQAHVKLVGEETGGGAYGNTGIMIPTIKLPNTSVKVRLPLYRVVQPFTGQKKGQGILPDIAVPPSYDALIKGYDKKMVVVKALINNSAMNN